MNLKLKQMELNLLTLAELNQELSNLEAKQVEEITKAREFELSKLADYKAYFQNCSFGSKLPSDYRVWLNSMFNGVCICFDENQEISIGMRNTDDYFAEPNTLEIDLRQYSSANSFQNERLLFYELVGEVSAYIRINSDKLMKYMKSVKTEIIENHAILSGINSYINDIKKEIAKREITLKNENTKTYFDKVMSGNKTFVFNYTKFTHNKYEYTALRVRETAKCYNIELGKNNENNIFLDTCRYQKEDFISKIYNCIKVEQRALEFINDAIKSGEVEFKTILSFNNITIPPKTKFKVSNTGVVDLSQLKTSDMSIYTLVKKYSQCYNFSHMINNI